jgi:hypothetical protein
MMRRVTNELARRIIVGRVKRLEPQPPDLKIELEISHQPAQMRDIALQLLLRGFKCSAFVLRLPRFEHALRIRLPPHRLRLFEPMRVVTFEALAPMFEPYGVDVGHGLPRALARKRKRPGKARPFAVMTKNGASVARDARGHHHPPQLVPNFKSLIASKSCTPPPTRFVV